MHRNQGPVYRDRVQTLIEDIRILLSSDPMEDGCSNNINYDRDLIRRLEIVDTIECLGIDRYFQLEIKSAMDYVYRFSIS